MRKWDQVFTLHACMEHQRLRRRCADMVVGVCCVNISVELVNTLHSCYVPPDTSGVLFWCSNDVEDAIPFPLYITTSFAVFVFAVGGGFIPGTFKVITNAWEVCGIDFCLVPLWTWGDKRKRCKRRQMLQEAVVFEDRTLWWGGLIGISFTSRHGMTTTEKRH